MPVTDLLSAPTPTPSPTWSPVAPPQITSVGPGVRVVWLPEVDMAVDWFDWLNVLINLLIAGATIWTLVWAISSTKREIRDATADRKVRDDDRKEERAERDRQAERDRRFQAEHVVAWQEQEGVYETVDEEEDGTPIRTIVDHKRKVFVLNRSSAPVYDVRVRYQWSGEREKPKLTAWKMPVLTPGETPTETRAPGLHDLWEDALLVEVEFRDAGGRVWRRDRLGLLHLVSEPTPDPRSETGATA